MKTLKVVALVFTLLIPLAAPAEVRVELPVHGPVPVVETAGPFPERQSWETLAGAEWIPVVASSAGTGVDSYYWPSETVNLSSRFLPVTGRLYIRVRIAPVSSGERALKIASYHKSAAVFAGDGWQELHNVTMQQPSDALALTVEKDKLVSIFIETTPLYFSSKAALTWTGEKGDVLVVDGDIEQAILDALDVEPEKSVVERVASSERPASIHRPAVKGREAPEDGIAKSAGFGGRGKVGPGDSLALRLSWPRPLDGEPHLLVKGPDGREQSVKWGTEEIHVSLPGDTYVEPAVRIGLSMGGARRAIKVPLRPGIEKELARLQQLADSIPLEERKNHAFFLLRTAQVAEELSGWRLYGSGWTRLLERLEEAREAWEQGTSDFYGARPGFREDAYVSSVDLSPQPYLLYVSSMPMEKRPLVVYLHGYVPSYTRADWVGSNPMEYLPYEEAGAIYAVPFARSNTDFLTVGETDVLDVIEEVKRRFPIDPDRVYLVGYSMGGSGVWTLLTHYPDIWAGALVLAGRTDFYYWHNLDREKLSPWLNALILADNPVDLAENIQHLPVLVFHGDADFVVKKGHSKRMVEKLRELGAPVEFYWVHAADHWRAGAVLYQDDIIRKLLSFRRKLPVKFKRLGWLTKYANWRGIEVLAPEDMLSPVTVRADLESQGAGLRTGTVKVDNALFVKTPRGLVVEGFERLHESADGVFWGRGMWADREKSPYLSRPPRLPGTFRDLTSKPFAVVYGTGGASPDVLKTAAQDFAAVWKDFAKCPPLVYADTELPPGMERERSLILFGEAGENLWTSRAAPSLPFSIEDGIVRMGGLSHKLGVNDGYIITYPSPFAAGCYVALCGTVPWGRDIPVNHKFDFVPDIVVFRRGKSGFQRSDEYLWAGFFDGAWRVDEELIFQGHLKE